MKRKLLDHNQRITVPVDLFGIHFPFHLEPTIYNNAARLSANYRGGYWLMYRLSNNCFYMAPDAQSFRVSCPNGFEGTMSGDAFGIVVCLYAYSELCFSSVSRLVEVCSEQYHLLREYIFEHPEVEAILRAID